MPRKKIENVNVVSNGYSLWKRMQAEQGKVTLENIADETGLNVSTVRAFVAELRTEVGTSTLQTAALIAHYFGVSLDQLLKWEITEPDPASAPAPEKG